MMLQLVIPGLYHGSLTQLLLPGLGIFTFATKFESLLASTLALPKSEPLFESRMVTFIKVK
jgi:hypothetical protein